MAGVNTMAYLVFVMKNQVEAPKNPAAFTPQPSPRTLMSQKSSHIYTVFKEQKPSTSFQK